VDQDPKGRAGRLREKAVELRCLAHESKTPFIRMTLLSLAEDYDKLSRYAERRIEGLGAGETPAVGSRTLRAVS
jgi:hypothetical protein